MYQFQFRIPPYYTLLVRSLSVLEVGGWAVQGVPGVGCCAAVWFACLCVCA